MAEELIPIDPKSQLGVYLRNLDAQQKLPVQPGAEVPEAQASQQRLNQVGTMDVVPVGPGGPTAEEIMRGAKEKSAQEATQVSGQLFRNVAVPAAQAGLAMATSGASIPAQIAINAGTEAALQGAGVNPRSNVQLGLAAGVPAAIPALTGAVKGIGRATANILGKGGAAGEQAIAKTLGVPADVIERSRYAPSKAVYQAVRGQGEIGVSGALKAVQNAVAKETALGSQANKQTLKYLKGIESDLSSMAGATEDAKVMTDRAQRISKMAEQADKRGHSTLAATLKDAANEFKGGIPGLKEADRAYTRELLVDDIFKAARSSNKLKAVDDLIAEKGQKMAGVMSDKDLKDIRKIVSQVVDLGGSGSEAGIVKTAYEGILKSFLADPNGLTVFRHAFGPDLSNITAQRLAGLATFMRGYMAQKQRRD